MTFYIQQIMKLQEMDKLVIPVHSLIDLITNSSTEIFVHSENSVKPAKELLTEFLKLNGIDKKCDEVFDVIVQHEEYRIEQILHYGNIDEKSAKKIFGKDTKMTSYGEPDVSNEQVEEAAKKVIKDIEEGKPIPKWLDENSYHSETKLIIKSKDSKYDKFLSLLSTFLYSPDWFEHQWG